MLQKKKKSSLFCTLLPYDAKKYGAIRYKTGMNEDLLSMALRIYHSPDMQRTRAVKERIRQANKTKLILVLIVSIKASRKVGYDDGNFCDYKFCVLETEIVKSFCPH